MVQFRSTKAMRPFSLHVLPDPAAGSVSDEFVAMVSHELRAPLSSVTGYLELLRESFHESADVERTHMLEGMTRGVARLERTIDNLLALATVTSERVAQTAPVDMGRLIEQAVDVLGTSADSHGVSVMSPTVAPGSVVVGNAGLLETLVLNLLSNAVKFTENGGTVRVSGAVAGARFLFQVSDTGIGIAPDDLDRVFTPFFRSTDATARRIGGSGLGLTIVKRIVDQHDGTIMVASEPGIGTTVEVTLPLAVNQPAGAGEPETVARVTIFAR